jgi:hypothetical protein
MYACLRKLLSGVQYHARAKMLIVKPKQEDRQGPLPPKQRRLPGMMCVVSAGPEDQAAADQVKLVAEHMGCFVTTKAHFNIRDLQGLMDKLPGENRQGATGWLAGFFCGYQAGRTGWLAGREWEAGRVGQWLVGWVGGWQARSYWLAAW